MVVVLSLRVVALMHRHHEDTIRDMRHLNRMAEGDTWYKFNVQLNRLPCRPDEVADGAGFEPAGVPSPPS